jgi:hypothetical protein
VNPKVEGSSPFGRPICIAKLLPSDWEEFFYYLPLVPLGVVGRGAYDGADLCGARDGLLGRGDEFGVLDAGLGVCFCGAPHSRLCGAGPRGAVCSRLGLANPPLPLCGFGGERVKFVFGNG